MQDPRFRNKTFAQESIRAYLSEYTSYLQQCLETIPQENLDAASRLMSQVRLEGGRIFVAGNGGSAAISEHLCCDWKKGIFVEGESVLKVQSLTSNAALLTAIANDFGYEKTFAFQLKLEEIESRDALLLISSSGNSENIVQAAQYAKEKNCPVIGLTGFMGGKLKEMSDISLHIPFDNYGLVEDAHQMLMHVLAQFHNISFAERN